MFNSLLRLTTGKTSDLHMIGFLWGVSTDYQWIPLAKASNVRKLFYVMILSWGWPGLFVPVGVGVGDSGCPCGCGQHGRSAGIFMEVAWPACFLYSWSHCHGRCQETTANLTTSPGRWNNIECYHCERTNSPIVKTNRLPTSLEDSLFNCCIMIPMFHAMVIQYLGWVIWLLMYSRNL